MRLRVAACSILVPALLASLLPLTACSDEGAGEASVAVVTPAAGGGTVSAAPADDAVPTIFLAAAYPQLSFNRPVFLTAGGDGSRRLYVVEQAGRILVFDEGTKAEEAEVFLDLRARVRSRNNEEGLLALAFHPRFAETGAFYVYYTASGPRRGVLSRFLVDATNRRRAEPGSERVILEVPQPYGNHNGSAVVFGPDGYLYVSLGDGGAANDPHDHGQNLETLLGSIIRIDVDRAEGDRAYAIPPDNPFVGRADARGEIWAYGLRNVWRMSFDRETGDLWAGDVGQNRWEEIDLITKGGNYGWNLREGAHPFRRADAAGPLIDPVVEYPRNEGISVTGGYVYRGNRNPALRGAYVYADYVSGRIWGLRLRDGTVVAHREILADSKRRHIASFGEGPDGELYVCAFDRVDGRRGRLYQVVQAASD